MEQEVLPISNSTCREAASLLGRAFQDNPVPVAILQGLPAHERVKRLASGFAADLAICVRKGKPLIIKEDDSIVAAAIIYPPGSYPLPLVHQILMLTRTIWHDGFYGLGRWMTYLSSVERLHPKQLHYYLEYLGVEPVHQGKGLGSALLRFLTAEADIERMGCYLENANPRNNALYHHFGFQTIDEIDIIGVHNWLMWRTPNINAT